MLRGERVSTALAGGQGTARAGARPDGAAGERAARRRTALVTGASAGIGRELAHVFAANGFDLVLVARTAVKLEALAAELGERHGVRADALPTDLLAPGAPQALFDEVAARGIQVEVLVNDAGRMSFGGFGEAELEQLLDMIRLNAVASTALTRLFVAPMLEARRGRVLNVGSIGAFLSLPSLAVYAATKAFILSLSESLAEELRGTGVTVTALCPGFTATEMLHEIGGLEERMRKLPGAFVMEPREVAEAGYRACMAGDVVWVPGALNRLAIGVLGWQPRWLVRRLGGLLDWWMR